MATASPCQKKYPIRPAGYQPYVSDANFDGLKSVGRLWVGVNMCRAKAKGGTLRMLIPFQAVACYQSWSAKYGTRRWQICVLESRDMRVPEFQSRDLREWMEAPGAAARQAKGVFRWNFLEMPNICVPRCPAGQRTSLDQK